MKSLSLPVFFPDATYGSINSVPFSEVDKILSGIVITTLHLHLLEADDLSSKVGSFSLFTGVSPDITVLSDSGGFQVLSLLHKKGAKGISEKGATFTSEVSGKKILLTPEKSQQIQHSLKSDIRVVLDYPIMGDEPLSIQKKALTLTSLWAKRAKDEFLKLNNLSIKEFELSSPTSSRELRRDEKYSYNRPLLVGIIQGGNNLALRKQSMEELSEIDFDIYGFGGWPVDQKGKLLTKVLQTFVDYTPNDKLLYGMGIGKPEDIKICYNMGIKLFDCVIPTRNARHGTLYVSKGNAEKDSCVNDILRIRNSRYQYDTKPIDPECECVTCKQHSRAYVRYLLKNKSPVGFYLASVHNIWWYLSFMNKLKV